MVSRQTVRLEGEDLRQCLEFCVARSELMSPEIYDALLSSLGSSMAGTVDSGTSGGGPTGPTTATPATPATTATHHDHAPQPTAKQRAQSAPKRPRAGGVSETNTAPARPPATTSFFVHRRATPGPLAVEHQLEADREAMDALAKGMVALEKVSAAQQAQIETLTRANGQINRNAIGLEKAVLDRVEAAKLFAAKDAQDQNLRLEGTTPSRVLRRRENEQTPGRPRRTSAQTLSRHADGSADGHHQSSVFSTAR